MAEHIRPEKVKKTLDDLIETLRDGHQGFMEFGNKLQNAEARRFFMEETQTRSNFAGELENELHRLGVKDVHVSQSVASRGHRFWAELKAKLGGGDHALLETAEQGEDAAKKSYADALKNELPAPIRELVERQQAHILQAHDKVKALRDSSKKS